MTVCTNLERETKLSVHTPSETGVDMGIKRLPDGRYKIVYDYRKPDGTATHAQKTLPADSRKSDLVKAQAELVEQAEKRSLKSTSVLFEDIVDAAFRKNKGGGQPWIYKEIRKQFEGIPVGKSFVIEYEDYLEDLEDDDYAENSINHRKSAIRFCLNHAYETGKIDNVPIRKWNISYKFRDRIWIADEKQRIYNMMEQIGSHLYWAVWFSERRPIRKGDLIKLTDDNLVLFGENAPYLRFRAGKTKSDTYLPLAELPEIVEYFKHGRLPGCKWLFPGREGENLGNFKRHWNYILTGYGTKQKDFHGANVEDFKWHDLRHIAFTFMLDNGYTIQHLLNLGIGLTEDVIKKVYYNYSADKVLSEKNQPKISSSSCSILESNVS